MTHSGRFTRPAVVAAESQHKRVWAHVWSDGRLTPDEEVLLNGSEEVVYETRKVDANQELINTMQHRDGFASPQVTRRFREVPRELMRFRPRGSQPDPTPAGPAAAQKLKAA